ncbi:RidA family protein [Aliihoeflea aestuarii]|jgi:enamine deaminase RidA (YjgF/YER057c/UK114 family)|uniref:RidA family protein n=1 Tax=Aliihoeflea aestuarii TaxID=453840 RepID=UPI002092D98E|nr:RidA family protein [Aliihoeflea aestuarii]MCO6391087.1 RidA family protein [Aliihoeflea aestuarii]
MTITRHETGPRMSHANIFNGVVYLAGQVGDGETVKAQTESILTEIDRLLAVAGSSKSRILSAQIWLSDMADFAEMNAAWDAWVDPANTPARATGEAKLAAPKYKVEIIVVAAQD